MCLTNCVFIVKKTIDFSKSAIGCDRSWNEKLNCDSNEFSAFGWLFRFRHKTRTAERWIQWNCDQAILLFSTLGDSTTFGSATLWFCWNVSFFFLSPDSMLISMLNCGYWKIAYFFLVGLLISPIFSQTHTWQLLKIHHAIERRLFLYQSREFRVIGARCRRLNTLTCNWRLSGIRVAEKRYQRSNSSLILVCAPSRIPSYDSLSHCRAASRYSWVWVLKPHSQRISSSPFVRAPFRHCAASTYLCYCALCVRKLKTSERWMVIGCSVWFHGNAMPIPTTTSPIAKQRQQKWVDGQQTTLIRYRNSNRFTTMCSRHKSAPTY